jgi:hypothetical protein
VGRTRTSCYKSVCSCKENTLITGEGQTELSYNETKVYIQKQIMSVKSRHLLLLFYKISIPIYAFLSPLQNLKDASAVEVRSSSSLPASHGFLACLVNLVVVTTQISFKGSNKWQSEGRQTRTVECMGEQFPVVLCSSVPVSKRGTQREQTFRYPKISSIFWTAWCPIPICAAVFLLSFGLV